MKIEINNLSKKFKNSLVLDNINVNFEEGKIYGLVGRNGSGKSVLLKIICGFYYPTSGEVLFDGINYIKNGDFPKETSALIEKPSFIDLLSGYENLKILAKINNNISEEEIIETLKLVELYDDKDKLYYKYSLGMKQKLGIAQALMENPKIIILDEPFNGIEEETAIKLRNHLVKLKEEGKIIILATHIKDDITSIVDVIYKIKDGHLIEEKKDNN